MANVKPGFKHRNLPLLLLQARESVISLFRPILNAHGLTEQQWRILRVLIEFDALEPRQIVGMCGISSPSLAGILARMEEQGLIKRKVMPGDRRRQTISATASSRRLAARMAPEVEATYAQIEARVGNKTMQSVYAMLDGLMATLEDTSGDDRQDR